MKRNTPLDNVLRFVKVVFNIAPAASVDHYSFARPTRVVIGVFGATVSRNATVRAGVVAADFHRVM